MNIFGILNNLYCNSTTAWFDEVEDEDIVPFVIQRWLLMNDAVRVQVRWLDKYVFSLPPRMYLSLVWSILPKSNKPPFVKYIKQSVEEEEYACVLDNVKKYLHLSDNDYNAMKSRFIVYIKQDKEAWFHAFGVDRLQYKRHGLEFKPKKTQPIKKGSICDYE